MPSHQNVWCGNTENWFQLTFWVRKLVLPAAAQICGSAPEYPKESGSQVSVVSSPNSRKKKLLPWMNCRAIASEPGMFVSDSTHMPPTGMKRPLATCVLMRSNSSG